MRKINFNFEYTKYDSTEDLDDIRKKLIQCAITAAKNAYAPYSNFHVGAAVLLNNGEIITGNNQENASYPVGICAERTLLSYVHANFPNQIKKMLAVSVLDTDLDASPCGLCRQTLLEYEIIQNQPIEILLHNRSDAVIIIPSCSALLPLHFDNSSLI
ncbi:MAG: cytidine deaminase [Weeksellaceae bacterium]